MMIIIHKFKLLQDMHYMIKLLLDLVQWWFKQFLYRIHILNKHHMINLD